MTTFVNKPYRSEEHLIDMANLAAAQARISELEAENKRLRAVLIEIRDAIIKHANDTLWLPGKVNITLVELIDNVLGTEDSA